MKLPTTVAGVIEEMHTIGAALEPTDGVQVFNAVYLQVTERIDRLLDEGQTFEDVPGAVDLDTRFAGLWLSAYDAADTGRALPKAWAPLFSSRHRRGLLPIQFALAGMNTHIEHDLPIAVVDTCEARGLVPDDLHADFEAVNGVLARVESDIRRSFLDEVGRAADDGMGRLAHLVSCWSIDQARDVAWVTAETIWTLRELGPLRDRYLDALGHTVGMTTSALLTAVV